MEEGPGGRADSAPLLNNLGLVAVGKQQDEEAIAYFQRAMRLRPNYTDAHLNLGRLDERLGRTADAELQLQAAVALAPLSFGTRNELGKFYFNAGRLPEAEAQFRASAAGIVTNEAYDWLGDIARQQGKTGPAEQEYRRALSLNDFDSRAHFGLGGILAASGHTAEAADQYRAGLSADPRNQEALAALQRLTRSPDAKTPKP